MSKTVQPTRFSQKENITVLKHTLPPTEGHDALWWLARFCADGVHVDDTMRHFIQHELDSSTGVERTVTLFNFIDPKDGTAYYNDLREAQHRESCVHPVPLEAVLQFRLYTSTELLELFGDSSVAVFYQKEFQDSTKPWLRIDITHRFGADFLFGTPSRTPFEKIGSGCFLGFNPDCHE